MNLLSTIQTALELTDQLQMALDEGQLEKFAEVLQERETVMVQFQAHHQAADSATQAECAIPIENLQRADAQLQKVATVALTAAGEQMRASVDATLHYNGSYNKQPDLACVDRKA